MTADWILLMIGIFVVAMVILWPIFEGIKIGLSGGKIYSDNTPPLGPHHWNTPLGPGV